MTIQSGKQLTIAVAMILSWVALLWINFYADLSVAMHFVAIPFLLLMITGYGAYHLEQSSQGNTAHFA